DAAVTGGIRKQPETVRELHRAVHEQPVGDDEKIIGTVATAVYGEGPHAHRPFVGRVIGYTGRAWNVGTRVYGRRVGSTLDIPNTNDGFATRSDPRKSSKDGNRRVAMHGPSALTGARVFLRPAALAAR